MPTSRLQIESRMMAALCGLCLVSCVHAGDASDAGSQGKTWWLRVAAFHADLSTRVRIDNSASGARGTDFAFERLGMPSRTTLPALDFGLRLAGPWRLELEYFRLARTGRAVLDGDLKFDDTVFPVQASFDSRLRSDVARASVGYSFLRRPTLDVGVVAGLHVTRFDMALQSSISVDNAAASVDRAAKDVTVPLPVVGGYGSWVVSPGWTLDWRVDFFSLKHRGYDGRLLASQANLVYRFTPNAAIGGGLRYVDYKLRSDRSDIQGKVDYRFTGPQLFVEWGF